MFTPRSASFRLAVIFLLLFFLCGSACLAQRNRRSMPSTPAGADAGSQPATGTAAGHDDAINAITGGRRRRFQGAANASPADNVAYTPAPRKGPLDINVLKYAFVDVKTHTVTFVGTYDPAYATGPLPYADMLKDAQNNPYPSFSLEPNDAEAKAQFAQLDGQISADIARMNDPNYCTQWGSRLSNILLNDTTVPADSKRFFTNMASAMGMSGDEVKRIYDTASGKIETPTAEFFGLVGKMMRGIGVPKAGDGLEAMGQGGSPQEVIARMAHAMNLTDQYDALASRNQSGQLSDEQFRVEGIILCVSEICRQFDAPESEIQSIVSSIRSGGQSPSALTHYMADKMGDFITNRAGARMINNLVLGPEVISRFYNLPVPHVQLVFSNVAPDSSLANILFKADYRLKSICAYPDVRERIPAHLTNLEFLQQESIASQYNLPSGSGADIGHTLVPGEVKMRVSPNGEIIAFEDAHIKVTGWVRGKLGTMDSTAADFVSRETTKYADYLTQHYDDYARVYPEWHAMEEAAKVVALARWAKQNNLTINVADATGAKIPQPASVEGFWSAVLQTNGDKASLTVNVEGGASFAQDQGEDWLQSKPDVTVTADVSKQLVASAIFAKQAAGAALSGDLESARELADKSALAMSGTIDLTRLPTLDGAPLPQEPAAYAQASAEAINQASDDLKKMEGAEKELAHASQIATTNPDEAAKITQQAHQEQADAQADLKRVMDSVSTYQSDPSRADDAVVALQNHTVFNPVIGNTGSGTTVATGSTTGSTSGSTTAQAKPVDWSAKCAEWSAELDQVNKQIASTREVLLKLQAANKADVKLYGELEKDGDDGFDSCVNMAGNVAVDYGISGMVDRSDEIYKLAKKLPGDPKDVIEKYRLLNSLAHRMAEAKTTNDFNELCKQENKSEAELYQTMRDGVGQIIGLLSLDKTVPGAVWKYGSLASDLAYNLTQLRQDWKNVETLDANNARFNEALQKLTKRMHDLVERQQDLRKKIEAGEDIDFSDEQ